MAKLTDVAIRAAESGRHQDGDGLMLAVKTNGSKFWTLRIMKHGTRSDLGLGSYPAVSLSQARTAAQAIRERVKNGADVVGERRQAKAEALAAHDRTFEKVALLVHGRQQFKTDKLSAAGSIAWKHMHSPISARSQWTRLTALWC